MTDYTDLIEQLLTKSENSPWDSLMDDAAIALQSQGKRIAELEAQLADIRSLLPDSLHPDSKDWAAGNLAERIEWMKIGYESQKSLASEYENQLCELWEQSPIGEVTHSDVLPGDDGLYRHEFRSSERIGLQAELFARPVKVDEAQSPVGYQELFNAISAATDTPYPGAVGVSVKAFTENIGPLYKRPVPSEPGKVTVTTDDHGRCVAVTRTDDEGRILSVIWEAGEMEKPANAPLTWLRETIKKVPTRTEPISGQQQRYVALDEVLGWIDVAEGRSAAQAQKADPVNARLVEACRELTNIKHIDDAAVGPLKTALVMARDAIAAAEAQHAELASAVGVTQSSISHYETGKADPSVDVGIRIAAVAKERGLVVSLDDIYAQDASQLLRHIHLQSKAMTDTSILDDGAQIERNDSPVFRNGVLAPPDSASARRNLSALLRACQDVGYSAVGAAVLHDKSWVCRLLKGEAVANLYEWLWVMEVVSISMCPANEDSEIDAAFMQALLGKLKQMIDRAMGVAGEGEIRMPVAEYKALLLLAGKHVQHMEEAYK